MGPKIVPYMGRDRQILHQVHDVTKGLKRLRQGRLAVSRSREGQRLEISGPGGVPVEGIAGGWAFDSRRGEPGPPSDVGQGLGKARRETERPNEYGLICYCGGGKGQERIVKMVTRPTGRNVFEDRATSEPPHNRLRPAGWGSENGVDAVGKAQLAPQGPFEIRPCCTQFCYSRVCIIIVKSFTCECARQKNACGAK